MLLLRQWKSIDPIGVVVPEGLDDVIIEYENETHFIQIKSRKEGYFTAGEIERFYKKSSLEKRTILKEKDHILIITEQPVKKQENQKLEEEYLENFNKHLYSVDPLSNCITILKEKLNILDGTALVVVAYLYYWISHIARNNGFLKYEDQEKITQTDLNLKITIILEAGGVEKLEEVIQKGLLKSVDFLTPLPDKNFYAGVKVQPGHITAGLVFDRPEDLKNCIFKLGHSRKLIINAPSGAGKSALMWMTIQNFSNSISWYALSGRVKFDDLSDILRFVRVFQPSNNNRIGIAVDDIKIIKNELWDALCDELGVYEGCYLIGTTRIENLILINNQSNLINYTPQLTEHLAESIWQTLTEKELTDLQHWRESFENSKCLLLEYMHILTQGENMQDTINGQIKEREKEKRTNELNILRSVTLASTLGGEIDVQTLMHVLDIPIEDGSSALKRLLNEHLVTELVPGVLGGVHDLRSDALLTASHDSVLYLLKSTLEITLPAITIDTCPHFIQQIINDSRFEHEDIFLSLKETLLSADNINLWSAVFEGLTNATVEVYVTLLVECLEKNNFPKSLWSFAANFADPKLDIPEFGSPETSFFDDLKKVYSDFRAISDKDYRKMQLDMFDDLSSVLPEAHSITDLSNLFESWAPILGNKVLSYDNIKFVGISDEIDLDIDEVVKLLEIAYFIAPELSEIFLDELGGQEKILSLFKEETPFVSLPEIIEDKENEKTISTNWYSISDLYQGDPHASVVKVCEKLLAIAPSAKNVSCAAVSADGEVIRIANGHAIADKNIPRDNLPFKIRVSLNQKFIQLFDRKYGSASKTTYANTMKPLIIETEKIFRDFSESWLLRKNAAKADGFAKKIHNISAKAQSIPKLDNAKTDITSFIISILKNIIQRIANSSSELKSSALPSYLGRQAKEAKKIALDPIWNYIDEPPIKELNLLENRLLNLSDLLHEMVGESSFEDQNLKAIFRCAKKASRNKAVLNVANMHRYIADQRLLKSLEKMKNAFKTINMKVDYFLKEIEDIGEPYWPRKKVCVVIHIINIEQYLLILEQAIGLIKNNINVQNHVVIVPAYDDEMVTAFAMNIYSESVILNVDFIEGWESNISISVAKTPLMDIYELGLAAVHGLSGLVAYCALTDMHDEEVKLKDQLEADFKKSHKVLSGVYESSQSEIIELVLIDLEEKMGELLKEEELKKDNKKYEPMCALVFQAMRGEYIDDNSLNRKIIMIEDELKIS